MLHAFITDNHEELVARVRAKAVERAVPESAQPDSDRAIPLFLAELAALLEESMTRGEATVVRSLLEAHAGAHARDTVAKGQPISQVVHDYGDVCQVVTELALEREQTIPTAEFCAFNRCLDDAIARAVTEYARVRAGFIAAEGVQRLGMLAHELRNVLSTAVLSFDAIRRMAAVPADGIGAMHTRSLLRLRELIDRSLTEVRLDADLVTKEPTVVAELIEETEAASSIEARAHGVLLAVSSVGDDVIIDVDREVLRRALTNLLQNAFKFTRPGSLVSLHTHATMERVEIDVEDECGGLPENNSDMFRPFGQASADRSGLGLGLSIARRAVEANGGELHVHNLPRKGCRFTVDLPRHRPEVGNR